MYAQLAAAAREFPRELKQELRAMLLERRDPSTYVAAAGMTLAQYAVALTLNSQLKTPHAAQGAARRRTT